jgi:hypothetical protein
MVDMRATAKTLHGKALSSLRTAMTAFNSPYDDGRPTVVLLHLQHAFEMLLKAACVQGEPRSSTRSPAAASGSRRRSTKSCQLEGLKLTQDEAGTLLAIDALRDDEQHWFNDVAKACSTSTPGLR